MIGAAVFAVGTIMLLIDALEEWLATIVNSEALAAFLIGLAMALIALGLGLYGRKTVSSSLTPSRTTRSVQSDTRLLSKRVAK